MRGRLVVVGTGSEELVHVVVVVEERAGLPKVGRTPGCELAGSMHIDEAKVRVQGLQQDRRQLLLDDLLRQRHVPVLVLHRMADLQYGHLLDAFAKLQTSVASANDMQQARIKELTQQHALETQALRQEIECLKQKTTAIGGSRAHHRRKFSSSMLVCHH